MQIDEMRAEVASWNGILTKRMKKYIHYRTITNFILHFDEIRDQHSQEMIISLLSQYIIEIKENNYEFDGEKSYQLYRKYSVIAKTYVKYSSFVEIFKINIYFAVGLLIDTGLYIFEISRKIYFIPVSTICLVTYYFIIKLNKEKKGRLYGLFY